jgi:hypothetical protein
VYVCVFVLDVCNFILFFCKLQVQARECLFEKQQSVEKVDSSKIIENGLHDKHEQTKLIELAQEAQLLSDEYVRVSELLSHEELKEFIPPAWSSLVQVIKILGYKLFNWRINKSGKLSSGNMPRSWGQ